MSDTINKTLTAVGTAIVIGTGAVVTYNLTTNNKSSEGIDWSQYDLNIPTLNVPGLNIPDLNIPNLDLVDLSLPKLDIDDKEIKEQSQLDMKQYDLDYDKLFAIDKLNLNNDDLNKIGIEIQELPNPVQDLPQWIKFAKEVNKYFIDKRMVSYDNSINYKNRDIINKWLEIYNQYKDAKDIAFIPINKKFRMITEVFVPRNNDEMNILNENLNYYKSQGYDSVLVCFDKNTNEYDLLNLVKYIISYHKMDVWFTYTGNESLKETVFMNADKYTEILKMIAPYAKGFINSWRRTSVHLWEQDDAWKKYTNTILRNVNPNIYLIGELYYGNTHKYDSIGNVGFGMNMFKNASACMIVNFGYQRIDMEYLFNVILQPYLKDIPKVGCVVGHRPYYLTDKNNGLTYQENMKIKHEVQDKFFKYGCVGTVTLSNDGKKMDTNNLSSTLYKTLGK